ncbi:MAG: glycoside hydrolase family 97 protein [Prevotella sp.]|nr:glycoside hydrolase family 97 protein [Prevotella sp.]
MRKIFLTLLMAVTAVVATAKNFVVSSPNGQIVVTLNDEGGKLSYNVSYQGTKVLEDSPLGVVTDRLDLTKSLSIEQCTDPQTVEKAYELRTIKQRNVRVAYRQAVLTVAGEGGKMEVEWMVSDRDVAYRYRLLPIRRRDETLVAVVKSEASGFSLPQGTTTFLCPQSLPMTGFARTAPSYETNYTLDDAMGKNGWGQGYSFPCLFKCPSSFWLLISETGVDGSYCASRLLNDHDGSYRIGFPQEGECNGIGSVTPAISLPGYTPWRTITVGTLKNIVETTVANDLVEQKYAPSKEYTYGKGSWSWIIGMDGSCNYDEQCRYIDFSAQMGYRSVLVDAWWDKQIGYERMAQLADYGRQKGVGLFLWYNSNGKWNDAPQTPKGIMDNSRLRRKEMAWMRQNGILGIKVDFFGGDKQQMMQVYEDILSDANDFGLQVIFHGCTLPRGWERMYPNYVASEAVLASENLHFSQGMCDAEARNACTHTFIRNTVGSMDFGGSTLNKFYGADNQHGNKRRTSDVFALATAVLFQSSVQHFAMAPNNLTDAPSWAIDFMKLVPTTWDEIRFIDGYPGRYAIIARRCGSQWFVAGINADEQPLKKTISLPMISAGSQLKVYSDDANLQGSVKAMKQNKKQQFTVTIPCNGGVVIATDF